MNSKKITNNNDDNSSTSSATNNKNYSIDEAKLKDFMGKVVNDLGATESTVLVIIGDKLGLYKAMADSKPVTPAELASRTGTTERYVREWLSNQAAGGYISYNPNTAEYTLLPEQAMALANENSPVFSLGGFQGAMAFFRDEPKITDAFRTGKGVDWGDHDPNLYEGTERFFKPNYVANIVSSWIPSLDGGKVEEKLKCGGAKIADVGCGHGISTILMAKAYPNSKFIGFDYHKPSIEIARKRAKEEGLSEDRITFEVASSTDFPAKEGGQGYDLVAFFDCLHDMGDPSGAASHVLQTLKSGGTWMIVEPFANDKLEDNLNPIGRMYYAASSLVCVPASLSHNGPALGAQAGERRISKLVKAAGFKHFKRATQTPFNLIYEAKA
ncbi:MAG: tRNA ((7)-)-methyltransferase [Nitrososphaeraceae archaeon]|nr:tRNA ((7)-)-methyltransferase [Nitrososphaeraceae archaeon]